MNIRYIDGRRLKRALIVGGQRLLAYTDQLNRINVFPVADSDTGTNMAGTIVAVLHGLSTTDDRSVAVTTRVAADAALMGARGNSGAILAQFFYGLAEEFHDAITVSSRAFAKGIGNAVGYAYEALSSPKEGTILTVLRSWGHSLAEHSMKSSDFLHVFTESFYAAKQALEHTTEKLPSLRRAGVVDAGALGFVHIIEGIHLFITRGRLREADELPELAEFSEPTVTAIDAQIDTRYCTECLVAGTDIPLAKLRKELEPLGNSLIVAGSREKVRIHVHTDTPEAVFEHAGTYGEVIGPKADDMTKQFETAHTAHGEVAIVVDSACDIPQELTEKPYIAMVPLSINFGMQRYVDKIGLRPGRYYELLAEEGRPHPTTSQPTAYDFRKQYGFLSAHYRRIITLTLSGALSGTVDAARTGIPKELPEGVSIDVVDSKNVSVAVGLVVRRMAEAVEAGADADEVVSLARRLVDRLRLLVAVKSVDWMVKGGRVSKRKGLLAKLLGVLPVMTLDESGHAVSDGLVRSFEGGIKRILKTLEKELDSRKPVDFAVTHVNNQTAARELKAEIERRFTPRGEIFVLDAAPVLASHTGFGTTAVAYLDDDEA
ncbi:MAG: DAK2 domain-containing protein [Spirochaetota bacterium]